MAVTETSYKPSEYSCNGITKTFAIDFSYDSEDIVVVNLTDEFGDNIVLEKDLDYTIVSENIVTTIAYVTGNTIIIERNTPITQTKLYKDFEVKSAASQEAGLDKTADIDQELDYKISNTLYIKGGLNFPKPGAGAYIKYDDEGNLVTSEVVTADSISINNPVENSYLKRDAVGNYNSVLGNEITNDLNYATVQEAIAGVEAKKPVSPSTLQAKLDDYTPTNQVSNKRHMENFLTTWKDVNTLTFDGGICSSQTIIADNGGFIIEGNSEISVPLGASYDISFAGDQGTLDGDIEGVTINKTAGVEAFDDNADGGYFGSGKQQVDMTGDTSPSGEKAYVNFIESSNYPYKAYDDDVNTYTQASENISYNGSRFILLRDWNGSSSSEIFFRKTNPAGVALTNFELIYTKDNMDIYSSIDPNISGVSYSVALAVTGDNNFGIDKQYSLSSIIPSDATAWGITAINNVQFGGANNIYINNLYSYGPTGLVVNPSTDLKMYYIYNDVSNGKILYTNEDIDYCRNNNTEIAAYTNHILLSSEIQWDGVDLTNTGQSTFVSAMDKTLSSWVEGSGGGYVGLLPTTGLSPHCFVLSNDSNEYDFVIDDNIDATNVLTTTAITDKYTKIRRIFSYLTDLSSEFHEYSIKETSGGGYELRYGQDILDSINTASSTTSIEYPLSVPTGIELTVENIIDVHRAATRWAYFGTLENLPVGVVGNDNCNLRTSSSQSWNNSTRYTTINDGKVYIKSNDTAAWTLYLNTSAYIDNRV